MGKQVSLIKFTGKVGEVYGAVDSLTGDIAIRKMPVRKETKASEAQILQRVKFGTLGCLAQSFGKSIIGLNQYAKSKKMRAKNAFVHINKDKVAAETPSTTTVALDELMLSKGSAVSVDFGQPDFSERGQVGVSFTNNAGLDNNSRVILAVYQADLGKAVSGEGLVVDGSVGVVIPRDWSGMRAHVYGYVLAFGSAEAAEKFDAIYSVTGDIVTAELLKAVSQAAPSDTTYIGSGNLS